MKSKSTGRPRGPAKTPVSFRLEPELVKQLRAYSQDTGVPMNHICERALWWSLGRLKQEKEMQGLIGA